MDDVNVIFQVGMCRVVKWFTAAYFIILVLVFGVSYAGGGYDDSNPMLIAFNGGVVAIVVGMTLWCWWLSPKRLEVSDDYLTVVRRIGRKKLALADIVDIERYGAMGGDLRICGVGGVFGFTGWFKGKLGKYFAYVGDHRDTVMITLPWRRYVVSCDRPNELVAEVKRRMRQ